MIQQHVKGEIPRWGEMCCVVRQEKKLNREQNAEKSGKEKTKTLGQAAAGDKHPVAWDPDFYGTVTNLPISFFIKRSNTQGDVVLCNS